MNPNAPFGGGAMIDPLGNSGKRQIDGITVRDYIAIEAMKGILSNPETIKTIGTYTDVVSTDSYRYADALIAESNK